MVMTSNVGSREMSRGGIGFSDDVAAAASGDAMGAIRKHFTPEFRNRLDEIVVFGHLDEQVILQIVDKFLAELNAQLAEKNIVLSSERCCESLVCRKRYSPAYGARGVRCRVSCRNS